MSICSYRVLASIALLLAVTWSAPTRALTMQECSAKYRASQAAGTLKGMTWNEFRSSQCGPNASAAPAGSAATGTAPATTGRGSQPAGRAVFPSAVSEKYAKQSPGKARMLTCLDQYRANKANNGNANLRWIEKGGGYYSECTRRLSQR